MAIAHGRVLSLGPQTKIFIALSCKTGVSTRFEGHNQQLIRLPNDSRCAVARTTRLGYWQVYQLVEWTDANGRVAELILPGDDVT
jgi:hypothetical protein